MLIIKKFILHLNINNNKTHDMTDMQKTIEELKSKGIQYKVDKNPYGGYYVKYLAEKICMNGNVYTYTFWDPFREDGTQIRKQSHVTAI